MQEYLTDALVLGYEDVNELDRLVYLYTSDLGKITARVKSARKITSKLSSHLQPLNITKVRLVEKNGVQIVDAILIRQMEKSEKAIEFLNFIKEMTFEFHSDKKLWLLIKKSFEEIKDDKFSYKNLLDTLGFSPDFAECHICNKKDVTSFSFKNHLFFCKNCLSKVPQNEVILIK